MYFSDPGGDSGPALYTVDVWGRANNKVPTQTYASDPAWGPLRG
jgi:TolB protein